MGKKRTHIPMEVLTKYLVGEASHEEVLEVEVWKSLNPEEYLRLEVLWKDMGSLRSLPEDLTFDVDQAWKKVQPTKIKPISNPSTFSMIWRVAALLLIAFGLGYLMATFQRAAPNQASTFALAETIGTLSLADGSEVTLNQDSRLSYANDFGTKERRVQLEGEAFFEVAPDAAVPFIISAGSTEIKVVGTAFNVKTDNQGVFVTVESGVVLFSHGEQVIQMTANEAGYFDSTKQQLVKQLADPSGLTTFWKSKSLRFENQYLPEIASTLEAAYGIKIKLHDKELKQCQLHVNFENSSIEEVMDVIALTLELEIDHDGNTYTLTGKGCLKN